MSILKTNKLSPRRLPQTGERRLSSSWALAATRAWTEPHCRRMLNEVPEPRYLAADEK
jgi:hypothetical protein